MLQCFIRFLLKLRAVLENKKQGIKDKYGQQLIYVYGKGRFAFHEKYSAEEVSKNRSQRPGNHGDFQFFQAVDDFRVKGGTAVPDSSAQLSAVAQHYIANSKAYHQQQHKHSGIIQGVRLMLAPVDAAVLSLFRMIQGVIS